MIDMPSNDQYSFCIIIPTLNASSDWIHCLSSIRNQNINAKYKLIVDSNSNDNTVELSKKFDFDVTIIPKQDFGHGRTRQFAISLVRNCEFAVFLTQDAWLSSNNSIEKLLECFNDDKVAVAYGRQLGRPNASLSAKFDRIFNYPPHSVVKSFADSVTLGIKTAFISNSFAAYRISALKKVGGFPDHTIIAEDMYVAAKMLEMGFRVAYCAEATVIHSHDYTVLQTFNRYFDTGVFHAREPWIRQKFGGTGTEGWKFLKAEFVHLIRHGRSHIPYVLLKNVAKYFGFKIGLMEKYIPERLSRKLSMHQSFWDQ